MKDKRANDGDDDNDNDNDHDSDNDFLHTYKAMQSKARASNQFFNNWIKAIHGVPDTII